jgi:hypothetical protein
MPNGVGISRLENEAVGWNIPMKTVAYNGAVRKKALAVSLMRIMSWVECLGHAAPG